MATDHELSDFLKSVEKRAFKRTAYAVRDDEAALDIVQDSMIRLAEKYADRPVSELPLLFQRILSNATMDWFRRQRVRNAVVQNFSDFEGEGDGDHRSEDTTRACASGPVPERKAGGGTRQAPDRRSSGRRLLRRAELPITKRLDTTIASAAKTGGRCATSAHPTPTTL